MIRGDRGSGGRGDPRSHDPARHPKPHVLQDRMGRTAAPDADTAAPLGISPAAALEHAVVGVARRVEAVPAPLPDVTQGVVQALAVRRFSLASDDAGYLTGKHPLR